SFFFQAEDGIRDFHVTGVQTCALPISSMRQRLPRSWIVGRIRPTIHERGKRCRILACGTARAHKKGGRDRPRVRGDRGGAYTRRSEERRVGEGEGARGGREWVDRGSSM